jgi:hypothetical protein
MITTIINTTFQFLGITLIQTTVLVICILCLAAASIASLVLPKIGGDWTQLRRIPAMDVLDETVKICAEKGRPLLYSTGGMGTGSYMGEFVESEIAVGRYIAAQCAELGVQFYSFCSNPEMQMMLYDFVRQGYINAGKPEMFNGKNIIFIQSGIATLIMEHYDFLKMNRPGAFLGIGFWPSGTPTPVFQDAESVGAFSIGTAYWPDELSQVAMSADYTIMTAEQAVVGSYVDHDPDKMSAFVGEDFAKIILVSISIILGVLWLLGIKIFSGF